MTTPSNPPFALPSLKIISGGQTGADRAGLDVAIARGIPHGGWCPKGRKSEDGPLPDRYLLTETPTTSYLVRTERNAAESDATVIFTLGALSGGSKRTADFAKKHRRPFLHLVLLEGRETQSAERLAAFVRHHRVARLNVAGSRESKQPGIYRRTCKVLGTTLDLLGMPDPSDNGLGPVSDITEAPKSNAATAQMKDLPWGLSVDDFCQLYAYRAKHWTEVVQAPVLNEGAREFLLNCIPILTIDDARVGDVLPSGPDLLTFLSCHGYSIQISWLPARLNLHLSKMDVDFAITSRVHEFNRSPSDPTQPLGEEFDALVVEMIAGIKSKASE